jgi:tetratricopeptide (TPR) repeat protein
MLRVTKLGTVIGCALLLSLGALGCGKKETTAINVPGKQIPKIEKKINKEDLRGFETAIQSFIKHEQANDWDAATCKSMAEEFIGLSERIKDQNTDASLSAKYNAGLAYQRCHNDAEAKKLFEAVANADPKFHYAKVQVILYEIRTQGDKGLDSTIAKLEKVVQDAKFQNPSALVSLANLEMKRGKDMKGIRCDTDLSCAKTNIQRALAVDDSFMPAFNQLAIYYYEMAKRQADGGKKRSKFGGQSKAKKTNQQQLELAALVCDQAIKKNPKYAAIHNTAGLIQAELNHTNTAVREFDRARHLDAKFFEAHMNYAAVNLGFRGFKQAEEAYRAALKIDEKDYDAQLGLALALRGQITDSNRATILKESQEHLDKAKSIAPNRPEAYYNEGILTEEYKVQDAKDNKATVEVYKKAVAIYQTFKSKASGKSEYADQVKRANERIEDINATMKFMTDTPPPAAPPPAAPPPAPAKKP